MLPYLKDMEKLIMKNCKLTDQSAALMIKGALGGHSSLRHIDFTGIYMGRHFVNTLAEILKAFPNCLEELILADLRPTVSIGDLIDALMHAESLEYLDLSENTFNFQAATSLANLVSKTSSLEYLSLKACSLRDSCAQTILDALMVNKSIKYLNLS